MSIDDVATAAVKAGVKDEAVSLSATAPMLMDPGV